MSRWQKLSLWLAFAAVGMVAAYLWLAREQPEMAERLVDRLPPAVTGRAAMAPSESPAVAAVAPTSPAAGIQTELVDPALPALASSDAELNRALAAVPGGESVLAVIVQRELIRRFVATIDQLPRTRLPTKARVWKPLTGAFEVAGADGQWRPGAANEARYHPLVAAFLAVDPTAAVQLYRRWYPLVQSAYAESAGAGRLFHARLLAVLDHLLGAKLPTEPPMLVPAEGNYRFADPALEQESVGRKLLLRLGAEQAGKVRQRLEAYRTLLSS